MKWKIIFVSFFGCFSNVELSIFTMNDYPEPLLELLIKNFIVGSSKKRSEARKLFSIYFHVMDFVTTANFLMEL